MPISSRAARAADLDEQTSRTIAATPVLTVSTSDELARAAQLMVEHEVSHLVVVEPHSARPIGVLSTLDIARALAGFPERHAVTLSGSGQKAHARAQRSMRASPRSPGSVLDAHRPGVGR